MKKKNLLEQYRQKRTFSKTPEPRGIMSPKKSDKRTFVIQEHDARSLHFDLRLKDEAVLKSWAVPKGLPEKTGQRHLAIRTDNHPIDYAVFEGVIPEGEYGAGTVMIWDQGTYEPLKSDLSVTESLKNGELLFRLTGERIQGNYALIQTKFRHKEDYWLLVKMKKTDEDSQEKLKDFTTSVLSGCTLDELERQLEKCDKKG